MFGAIGSGGAILLIVVALALHKRGGGRIQPIKKHHVLYWGMALGILAAGAGQSLAQISAVANTINTTVSQQAGVVGPIGAGAVALLLLLVGFGTTPTFGKDLIVGVALPGALSAAGGVLAVPVTIMASLLHGFGA